MSSVEAETRASAPPLEPYVGLTYFTEDHADRFFGRERESAVIISNLCAARLTLLYAESGVGKSSVLRAGVVARLHEAAVEELRGGGGAQVVPVVFSSWSERPVAALVKAIGEAIRPYLGEQEAPELPEADLAAALEVAGEAVDGTIAVILDQFEEYFLYPDEAPEQDRIAAQIARCVKDPQLRANFLISIREDSYAELGDLFRGKVKDVYGNFLHLDFLDRAGAREAIEKPIERVNELQPESKPFTVEPALVDAVLDQVRRDEADEKVETTFLQLVMRRLWEEERRAGSHVLQLGTLERLGGAQAIIGSHLDRAMEGGEDGKGLTSEQRRTAAKIFRFLVTSGGTKIALTAGDLSELSGLPKGEIEPVLRHLSSPQLHILRPVVFQEEGSEPRFEIFHDALAEPIRKWRAKVEEEERNARLQRERAEKEEAQRAAAAAERQAEQERRRKRVAQALLALAVIALLAGAAFFAIRQKNLADQREADSQSVQAAERISELAWAPSFGPTAGALASIEAYELSPTSEARERALAQLQLNPGLPKIIAGHTRGVESVAFWPGSNRLVSGGDRTVRLWNDQGEEIDRRPLAAGGAVLEVAVSGRTGDGAHLIAAGLQSGKVKLWRVPAGGEPEYLPKEISGSPKMRGVAFDPENPELLAVGGISGEVALVDLSEPRDPREVNAGRVPGGVEDLAFAPAGNRLFVASTKAGVMFRLSKGRLESPVSLIEGEESAVAAGPDGSYAFGGLGGIELRAGGEQRAHLSLPGRVDALAFAAGGSVLVSGGTDWNVTTWDVASKRPFGPPRTANRAPINDVAVSADGNVAAAGDDRLVKVWPLEPQRDLAVTLGALSPGEAGGGVPKIFDLAGGGRHKIAVAAGRDGTLIWPLPAWGEAQRVPRPVRIPGRSLSVASHRFILVTGRGNAFAVYRTDRSCKGGRGYCQLGAPSQPHSEGAVSNFVFAVYEGRLLLASTGVENGKGVINLWDLTDVENGGRVRYLASLPTKATIFGIAFDRAKPIVAAATRSGELVLWDIRHLRRQRETGKPRKIVKHGEKQALYAVAFSPDSTLLASGGEGQQVVLWRVGENESGEITATKTPGTLLQRESINSLTFSPDGETLAAADAEGNICLYGVDNRQMIGDRSCLRGYNIRALQQGGIEAMKFARLPGGTTALLTVGRGQPLVAWNALLWNLNDTGPVDRAITNDVCALAGRNMTRYEWGAVFNPTNLAGERHKTCPQYKLP